VMRHGKLGWVDNEVRSFFWEVHAKGKILHACSYLQWMFPWFHSVFQDGKYQDQYSKDAVFR
jgi:hypothetical protein